MVKWVFVTGGVLSGLGKGVFSASLAKLLESRGFTAVPIKCDGYMNVDPGTMNPAEHGEVFVLQDGGEVDMDFGHYERFLSVDGRSSWNLTAGKVFQSVIAKEREGEFLGETVQIVPHVTDEVKQRFHRIADKEDADVVFVEIGGTVGDMENMIYLEAVRQLRNEEDSVLIHLTLVPFLDPVGEQKTKPTQHSVKELQRAGLQPDFVVGRSGSRLEKGVREKIALFCDVPVDHVISNPDIDNLYRLPLVLEEQGADELVCQELGLASGEASLAAWRERVDALENEDRISVALVGKYTDMDDTYVSIEEALRHAAAAVGTGIDISIVESDGLTADTVASELDGFDGIVVSPGFGKRGTDGKLAAIRHCREQDVPTLGICFGMQLMVVEYARNVCGLEGASSTEIDPETVDPIVAELPGQRELEKKGGTMRLGARTAELVEGSAVRDLYGAGSVTERHRHRFEVNPEYYDLLQDHGLMISGFSTEEGLAEFVELSDHSFFIGTQSHPEFCSGLEDPHPLYRGFVDAVKEF